MSTGKTQNSDLEPHTFLRYTGPSTTTSCVNEFSNRLQLHFGGGPNPRRNHNAVPRYAMPSLHTGRFLRFFVIQRCDMRGDNFTDHSANRWANNAYFSVTMQTSCMHSGKVISNNKYSTHLLQTSKCKHLLNC
jgi:hypothetical protein